MWDFYNARKLKCFTGARIYAKYNAISNPLILNLINKLNGKLSLFYETSILIKMEYKPFIYTFLLSKRQGFKVYSCYRHQHVITHSNVNAKDW